MTNRIQLAGGGTASRSGAAAMTRYFAAHERNADKYRAWSRAFKAGTVLPDPELECERTDCTRLDAHPEH